MPIYTVLLISVEVAEKRVEGVARELFNALFQHGQQRMPLQSAEGECKCHERRPGAGNSRQKAKISNKQNLLHFNHNKLQIKQMTQSNSDDIFSRAEE